jgi:hypothetical protein
MKTGFVNINTIVEYVKNALANWPSLNPHEQEGLNGEQFKRDREFLEEALEEYEMAITNPEMRERVSREMIGNDPYCWCVLPEFDKFEQADFDAVTIEWGDFETVTVPLLY